MTSIDGATDLAGRWLYRWTVDEWNRDVSHRAHCPGSPCGDIAHMYQKAIPDGRVIVDGEVVMADDQDLMRLTVKLTEGAHGALLEAEKATKHSQNEVINRALELYAFFTKPEMDGWGPALARGTEVRQIKVD